MISIKENDQLPQYVRDIVDFYTNQQDELKSLQEKTNQIGFDCNSKKFVAISPTQIHTDCKFVINNIQSVNFQELINLIEGLVLKTCDFYDVDKGLSLSLFLHNCLPTECYTKEDYFDRVDEVEITKDTNLWCNSINNNSTNVAKLWFYTPMVAFLIPFNSLKLVKSNFDRDFVRMRIVTDKIYLQNQNVRINDVQKWNDIVCLFFIRLVIFNETVEITKKQLNPKLIPQILNIDKDLTIKNYVEEFINYYLSVYDYDSPEYTACQLSAINEVMKIINQLSVENYQSIFKFLADNDVLTNFNTPNFERVIKHYIFTKLNGYCDEFDLNDFIKNLQTLLISLNKKNVFTQEFRFDTKEYEKQKLLAVIMNSSKIPDFPIEIKINSFKDWQNFVKLLKPNTEYNHLVINLKSFSSDEITFIQRFKIKKQLKQNGTQIKIVKEKLFG